MAKPEQCGHCKKPATIHLTQIVNNKVHKVDLCEDCPFKQNVTDPDAFSLADFLIKSGGTPEGITGNECCPSCGMTPRDFKKTGRFGCSECYITFKGMIEPMLANMHKDVVHCGKIPEKAIARVSAHQKFARLEQELQEAIQVENYEQAAKLRDQLNELRENSTATG